jgi:hypothetical protein
MTQKNRIFFNFWSSKPWIRIGIQPKMLDQNPDSLSGSEKTLGDSNYHLNPHCTNGCEQRNVYIF